MRPHYFGALVLLLIWGLAACNAPPSVGEKEASASPLTRTDEQGPITVKVTPLNITERAAALLEFKVVLDTHSVELSMDLSKLAALRTDTGKEVQATNWPVGSGHHYEAILVFPGVAADRAPLLENARTLTLILTDVGVPERRFEWTLTG